MIAPQRLPDAPPPRRAPVRTRRRARRRVALHGPLVAVVAGTLALLAPLLLFVTLTAQATSTNYALAREETHRAALLDQTQRLDDRIARLQSPERLAAIAAQLKLHDPHVYAVVAAPPPPIAERSSGFAFLGWFTQR